MQRKNEYIKIEKRKVLYSNLNYIWVGNEKNYYLPNIIQLIYWSYGQKNDSLLCKGLKFFDVISFKLFINLNIIIL